MSFSIGPTCPPAPLGNRTNAVQRTDYHTTAIPAQDSVRFAGYGSAGLWGREGIINQEIYPVTGTSPGQVRCPFQTFNRDFDTRIETWNYTLHPTHDTSWPLTISRTDKLASISNPLLQKQLEGRNVSDYVLVKLVVASSKGPVEIETACHTGGGQRSSVAAKLRDQEPTAGEDYDKAGLDILTKWVLDVVRSEYADSGGRAEGNPLRRDWSFPG